jgi:hypothetical protein
MYRANVRTNLPVPYYCIRTVSYSTHQAPEQVVRTTNRGWGVGRNHVDLNIIGFTIYRMIPVMDVHSVKLSTRLTDSSRDSIENALAVDHEPHFYS